jgi:predicted Zn-dependent protease
MTGSLNREPRAIALPKTGNHVPMDVATFRKLVALDPNDPLSRFALGKKLMEEGGASEALSEAAEHLAFANAKAPEHLATYHVLGQVLIRLGRNGEARRVLEAGVARTADVGEGKGRDLGPAMRALLETLSD